MGYTVAVIGATGNVGRELLSILAERASRRRSHCTGLESIYWP